VLKRFIDCADQYALDGMVRICSDNPFIDISSLLHLIETYSHSAVDYLSYQVNGTPSILTHFGFWAEIVRTAALKKVAMATSDPLYREHVTNYIYKNPSNFNMQLLEVPSYIRGRNDIRLTVDTREDFTLAARLFSELHETKEDFTLEDVIQLIDENPEILADMKKAITLNKK
jgi:spore coat polysaccharide biosynthesis protein SpsF